MKILLVNPSWETKVSKKGKRFNRLFPPLDLMYCAAILERRGFNVDIVDANVSFEEPEVIAQRARNYDKVIITSSPFYKWQCPNLDFETFVEFIAPFPKENLYVYGAHCSLFPAEVLKITGASGLIKGEPESVILDLCTKEKRDVLGLVYWQDDKVVSNSKGHPLGLNSLPIPAYHLVKDYNYFYEILGGRFMIFEGSRGCPYKCTYCLQIMYGNTYRAKSGANLIAEVELAIQRFGVKNGYFYDENFTSNKDLVLELCNYLIKNKYDFCWTVQTRPDSVEPEILKIMKQAGCVLIHFGVESGSQQILDKIQKHITIEKIKKGIQLTKSVGIETACFFMLGFPGEREEDFQATIELAKQLNPSYASFHIATPYPGTKFYEGIFKNRKALDFPQAYTGDYSLGQLEKMRRKAYCNFYLRPGYLIKRVFEMKPLSLARELQLFIDFIK